MPLLRRRLENTHPHLNLYHVRYRGLFRLNGISPSGITSDIPKRVARALSGFNYPTLWVWHNLGKGSWPKAPRSPGKDDWKGWKRFTKVFFLGLLFLEAFGGSHLVSLHSFRKEGIRTVFIIPGFLKFSRYFGAYSFRILFCPEVFPPWSFRRTLFPYLGPRGNTGLEFLLLWLFGNRGTLPSFPLGFIYRGSFNSGVGFLLP